MKKITILALCAIAVTLFTSCQKDEMETGIETPNPKVSKEVKLKLEAIGVSSKDAYMSERTFVDGSKSFEVRSGDYSATVQRLMETPDLIKADGATRQYRTNNLVTGSNKTINIIGYTGGGGYGLGSKERTGLEWAVANYNRLGISVTFNLTFGTDYQSKDMIVYHDPNEEAAGGLGGIAGFPNAQGQPNFSVSVYGLGDFSNNVNEHVITHEIGHSIGLRHTDWFSRQSCGETGESAGADGAIHIPGTPTGYDPTSIMLACFGLDSDGEFNANDTTALNYLY